MHERFHTPTAYVIRTLRIREVHQICKQKSFLLH